MDRHIKEADLRNDPVYQMGMEGVRSGKVVRIEFPCGQIVFSHRDFAESSRQAGCPICNPEGQRAG